MTNRGSKMSEGFFQIECPKCHRIFNPPEECECGYEHQCGGPQEACCIPGCLECGTKSQDVCVWYIVTVDHYDYWRSGCGRRHVFCSDDDTPTSDGFLYCPFCGKKIKVERV